jgi:hypothetical protein
MSQCSPVLAPCSPKSVELCNSVYYKVIMMLGCRYLVLT